jgi:hypothetical protein
MLSLRACDKVVEIHAVQPGIRRRDFRQGSPEGELSQDAKRQGFQGLEGAKPSADAAMQLHPHSLLA